MRFLLILAFLTGVAVVVVFEAARRDQGYRAALQEERRLQQQLAELRARNEELKREIRLLRESPFHVEKYARDTYGYAASNELVFKFER